MKNFTKISIVCLAVMLISSCASQSIVSGTQDTKKQLVSIQLPVGYIPNIQFAPLYLAIEKGYYQQEGLDVKLDYRMENDNVALVGASQLQFAVVSGEQVLLGRAQGLPVVYVMAWYHQYPVGIASPVEQGIKKPSDLKGKKVGLPMLSGASYIGLRALLEAAQLQEGDVQLDVVGFNQIESLTSKREQAAVVYIANEPVQMRSKGYEVDVIRVSDYLQLVANGLITNEATIEKNPDLVRKMVRATLKGINDTIANPNEAFDISKKYVENLGGADNSIQAVQKDILATSIGMWKGSKKAGYSEPDSWDNMNQLLVKMKLIEKPVDINQSYTNDFLPE